MRKKQGFTLVELLLVVTIIAIIASIVVPRISGSATSANNAKCDANWANLVRALELYATNNGGVYPTNQTTFDSGILNSNTYFPHGSPVCPYSTPYAYVETSGQETVTAHSH